MKKNLKYYFMAIMLVGIIGVCGAQQKVIKYEGGRKKSVSDSVSRQHLRDSLVITRDSLGKLDTLIIKREMANMPTDSLYVDTSFLKKTPDLVAKKDSAIIADLVKPERRKFSFTRDTIPAGRLTLLSLAPGVGQIYNRQYWKVPVIYGAMGGFIAGGVISSNRYNNLRADWQRTVNLNLPQAEQDFARGKMEREGMTRTLFFSAAAAVYFYQVADATFNYRGKTDHIRKATTLAAVFPGAGFIYTKTYWRLPIYYGGFITLATVIDYNNRNYTRFATAYNAATDNDPTTIDEFGGRYAPNVLQDIRNNYRRNRDFGIICMIGAYILSIVDTHVIATLKNWDISPNLSMTVEPTIINNSMHRGSSVPMGGGMSMKIRF